MITSSFSDSECSFGHVIDRGILAAVTEAGDLKAELVPISVSVILLLAVWASDGPSVGETMSSASCFEGMVEVSGVARMAILMTQSHDFDADIMPV